MKTKQNVIYALLDPPELGGSVRYIGQSAFGLSRALKHKKSSNLQSACYKVHWIKDLLKKNLMYTPVVIEDLGNFVDNKERDAKLNEAEIKWIKHYRELPDSKLTNSTEGGEGTRGNVFSDETKEKIRQKQLEHYKLNGPTMSTYEKQRKQHRFTNEKEEKHCSKCDVWQELSKYSPHARTWDKLNSICKNCRKLSIRESRAKNPPKKLSPEELKLSYQNRKVAQSEGLKKMYAANPDRVEKISENRSKAVIGVSEFSDFDVVEFSSAVEANNSGFNNTNIGVAIKSGKPYKGYIWKFKS